MPWVQRFAFDLVLDNIIAYCTANPSDQIIGAVGQAALPKLNLLDVGKP